MARIVATDDFIFSAAANSLYRFSLPGFQEQHIKTEELSNKIPKVKKPSNEDKSEHEQEDTSKNVEYQILCMCVSRCQKLLAVGTSHKTVLLFTIADLQLFRSFCIPKAPTTIVFDGESAFVIVGDRSGHVRRYAVDINSKSETQKDITGEICYYEGEPLMGAISMILDVDVSSDNKLLVVADRDEKIRIHRYPTAHVIEAFGLGHSNYVTSTCFVRDRLFSAGGDSTIKEWKKGTGEEISSLDFGGQPIKKVVIVEKRDGDLLAVTCLEGSHVVKVKNLSHKDEKTTTIDCQSEIMDICQSLDTVYGVCRRGLLVFKLDSCYYQDCPTPADFCAKLAAVTEPISNYAKNVTHQNMEGYQQRKRQKMLKEMEKKRKRKSSSKNMLDTEKMADN